MIHAAAAAGMIDLKDAMTESLLSIKRAGADMILTYFCKGCFNSKLITAKKMT